MDRPSLPPSITRRDVLKGSGAVVAAGLVSGYSLFVPETARAQTPKRGGTFRLVLQSDPVTGFDPHQTISFVTMVPLSFAYSRLVKVKAGPSVKPMTYPIEPDLAESWTQPDDKTYVFKLKKGVRWHPKPPVNGRELTADDVKYTYERFLTIKGNGNRPVLEYVDRIDVLDKYTVKFTLKEPNAWFLDLLASTSTWIVAKECVEKFGDLRKAESVVGTGPWMLERWEPNVKLVYVRNPHYFVPGLPYADGVEASIDPDPSSRLAAWLAGKVDFGPEYQQVVRRLDLRMGAFISTAIYGKYDDMMYGLRGAWVDPEAYFYRPFMPGQPLNILNVNDPKLTDMINLQRRTFDVPKRKQIVYDIQRYLAEQGYFGADGSVKVVSAWEPYIKNYMPNNGFDVGGRLMAAWIDK